MVLHRFVVTPRQFITHSFTEIATFIINNANINNNWRFRGKKTWKIKKKKNKGKNDYNSDWLEQRARKIEKKNNNNK